MLKKIIATTAITGAILAGPGVAMAQAAPGPVAQGTVISSQDEKVKAMQEWSATVGVATTIGTITGTGLGFVAGCILGTIPAAVTVILIPAGCLAGGVLGAAVGGVLGTVVIGGVTGIVAGQELVAVLIEPLG